MQRKLINRFQTTASLLTQFSIRKNIPHLLPTLTWLGDGVQVDTGFIRSFTIRLSNLKHNLGKWPRYAWIGMTYMNLIYQASSQPDFISCDDYWCNFQVNGTNLKYQVWVYGEIGKAILVNLTRGQCNSIRNFQRADSSYCSIKMYHSDQFGVDIGPVFYNEPDVGCVNLINSSLYYCIQDLIAPFLPKEQNVMPENDFIPFYTLTLAGTSIGVGSTLFFAYQFYKKFHAPTPAEFICPLTKKIMQDPVIIDDGYTYERAAIEELKNLGDYCPNNPHLKIETLLPNNNIKAAIIEFTEKNGFFLKKIFRKTASLSDDKEPRYFICPISLEIMKDPVVANDGNSYERSYIRQTKESGIDYCPKNPGVELTFLISNRILKKQIDDYNLAMQKEEQLISEVDEVRIPILRN